MPMLRTKSGPCSQPTHSGANQTIPATRASTPILREPPNAATRPATARVAPPATVSAEARLEDPAYEGYQLFTQSGWLADYDLASTFYNHVASCRLSNLTRYCNPAIDAVAKKAFDLEASDPGTALAMWSKVDRMLVDDGAFVTLGNRMNMEVVSTRVGNYQARATFGAVLSQLWVQ